MERSKDVEWFMHHAEDCKNPDANEFETQGGVCIIAASEYIKHLEFENREAFAMVNWQSKLAYQLINRGD